MINIPFQTTSEQQKRIPTIIQQMKDEGVDEELIEELNILAQFDQGIFDLMEEWERDFYGSSYYVLEDLKKSVEDYDFSIIGISHEGSDTMVIEDIPITYNPLSKIAVTVDGKQVGVVDEFKISDTKIECVFTELPSGRIRLKCCEKIAIDPIWINEEALEELAKTRK